MATTTTIVWSTNPGSFAVKDSYSGPDGQRIDSEPFQAVVAPLSRGDDLGLSSKGATMLKATIDGAQYMGGRHAARSPLASRDMSVHRLDDSSPFYKALVQMSYQHIGLDERRNGSMLNIVLASALPVSWLRPTQDFESDAAYKKAVEATKAKMEHHLRAGLKGLVNIKAVHIRSELACVVYHEVFDDAGKPVRENLGLATSVVGVADFGGGTYNWGVLENAEIMSAGSPSKGSQQIIATLQERAGIEMFVDAEALIRRVVAGTEQNRLVTSLINQYGDSVISDLTTAWRSYSSAMTAMLFSGGTAIWIKPMLLKAFGKKARVMAKPQQTVAIGAFRYAQRQLAKNK